MNTEKREAIEKAVIELGGEWSSDYSCLFTTGKNLDGGINFVGDYNFADKNGNHDGDVFLTIAGDKKWVLVCTSAEFEHVKADLKRLYKWRIEYAQHGYHDFKDWLSSSYSIPCAKKMAERSTFNWITTLEESQEQKEQPMKYEYGVEYECNGENPGLDSGVQIEITFADGNSIICSMIAGMDWGLGSDVVSFRIVDERYKPKEDGNWLERGELVRARVSNGWVEEATIVGRDSIRVDCYIVRVDSVKGTLTYELAEEVKPLRTERDKLIEQAERVIEQSTSMPANSDHLGILIDKGWRPSKN